MGYWDKKNELMKKAREHTKEMTEKYADEIKQCIDSTMMYGFHRYYKRNEEEVSKDTHISVEEIDSVSACFKYYNPNDKMAVLNFASYKNPGGMFYNGSSAQEESLCHESFLYNVLKEFENFYAWNCNHKNSALYQNRALYSHDVMFFKPVKKPIPVDVITCAAPNKKAAQKYCNVSDERAYFSMLNRIDFVLDIAATEGADILILGAYGCGVFGNDPKEVAKIFKECLDGEFKGVFKKVVFAIPKGPNYEVFKKVFEEI